MTSERKNSEIKPADVFRSLLSKAIFPNQPNIRCDFKIDEKELTKQLQLLGTTDQVNQFLQQKFVINNSSRICGFHFLVHAAPGEFKRVFQLASPHVIKNLESIYGIRVSKSDDNPLFAAVCQYQSKENIQLHMALAEPLSLRELSTDMLGMTRKFDLNEKLNTEERKEIYEEYKELKQYDHPEDSMKKNPTKFIASLQHALNTRPSDELVYTINRWDKLIEKAVSAANNELEKNSNYQEAINNLGSKALSALFKEVERCIKTIKLVEESKFELKEEKEKPKIPGLH